MAQAGGGAVVVVSERSPDRELLQSLEACALAVHVATPGAVTLPAGGARAVILDRDCARGAVVTDLKRRLGSSTRLIAFGSVGLVEDAESASPDCVVFARPDEVTMRGVLAEPSPLDPVALLDHLLSFSMFGADLPDTLQELTGRVARAFGVDNCVLVVAQDQVCYTARQVADDVLADMIPLCETVCEFGTTLIAPARADRPYRALLGVPLGTDSAAPLAMLVLCRERPVPYDPAALMHLRSLGARLASDLSARMVQARLLDDHDKLNEVSSVDPVLGVANRTALQEELARRVVVSERAGEPFSVAVIDVDGLRLINERNGYPVGDAVLSHVAQIADQHTRPQDLVARYIGDAVAIVMPGLGADDATSALTRILSEIDATPVVHEDKEIHLTVSGGVAELRYDSDTGEIALARAMAARQNARLHGEVIALAEPSLMVQAPSQPDYAIGTTLGGVYQIRHEIARGTFGVVYRAEDMALGRQVALKLLRPDLARDTAFVERFRHEASTLARIRNPNLVQVYAFGAEGTNVFFAMELIEGQGLDERIEGAVRRRRHLPLPEVMSVIDQVASALDAVHQAGMLHRDVKPENVLSDRTHRRCVLVDVGIAVRRGSEKNPAGTPGFTAPEVFGERGESPATDVYSLAAIAYQLLTLQPPFANENALEVLQMQAAGRPVAPTLLRVDLPAGVDAVLLSALDPDPAQRPQSARALAKALSDAITPVTLDKRSRKPRMTFEPPQGVTPRRVTFRNASLRSAPTPVPATPSTRGVLFRSAYDLLGARRGNSWANEVSRKAPELAQALGPRSSPHAWHPTTAFITVLESLGADDGDSRKLPLHLGRTAVLSSFGQFYGADLSTATPAHVLGSIETYWRCYHTWGTPSVTVREDNADVVIVNNIATELLCASTAGILTGVVTHVGGRSVQVEHPTCVADGARECVFHLTWRPR